jgi:hypothetical protein
MSDGAKASGTCHSVEVSGIPVSFHNAAIGMPVKAFENVRDFMHQYVRQQDRLH